VAEEERRAADHLGCDPGIARVRDEGFAELSTICVSNQCGFTATCSGMTTKLKDRRNVVTYAAFPNSGNLTLHRRRRTHLRARHGSLSAGREKT
jgi:hypothetical protein